MTKINSGEDDPRRAYPSDVTDAAWAVLEPLFPVRDPSRGGKPRTYGNRLVLDGILFVLRSGCQWRMVPNDLLPWDAAYRWFRTWSADGTWDLVHDRLRDLVRIGAGKDPDPTAGIIDAQSVKSSEGGEQRGFDAGKKTAGRKRHVVVDTLGLLLVVMVTGAGVQDRHGGKRLLARLAERFSSIGLVWADGGYANTVDSSILDWARATCSIAVEVVKRTATKGFQVLARRWVVERTFGWLVRNRRLARDYERLTTTSETFIKIAMIRLMATRLAGQTVQWTSNTEREAAKQLNLT